MMSRTASQSPTQSGEVQAIFDGLRHLTKVLRESSQTAEHKLGISGAQLFVLRTLAQESSLSVNELAARTFTHQSSVSVVVSKLVAAGLASRAPSREDARRVVLSITSRGKALLKRAPASAQDKLVAGIYALAPHQRRALQVGLAALVEYVAPRKAAPPMFFES